MGSLTEHQPGVPHLQSSSALCCNPEASLTSVIQLSFETNGRREVSEPSQQTLRAAADPLCSRFPTPACKCQLVQQGSVQAENFVSINAMGCSESTLHQLRLLQRKKKTRNIARKKWINTFLGGKQTGRCQPSSWTGTGALSSIQIPVSYCNVSFHHPPVLAQNYQLWAHSFPGRKSNGRLSQWDTSPKALRHL